MKNRKGLTLVDFTVVFVVVVFVLLLAIPLLTRGHRRLPRRLVCGTNLKGLGTAMNTYAFDYDDKFPVIGGVDAPWTKKLGWRYDNAGANYYPVGEQEHVGRTITASWYLLVREADVDPKSFICNGEGADEEMFESSENQDLVDLWDFGETPYERVSYAMQMPFGEYPATGASTASMAIAGDMSPWFKDGDMVWPGTINGGPQLITVDDKTTHKLGNSVHHKGEGQNVLYGDGHVEWTKTSNAGVENDNIYTYWSATQNPTEQDMQGGSNPVDRNKGTDSKSATDSFLAI